MDTKQQGKHTAGAIHAAETITGRKYGDKKYIYTAYGRKTTEGIADLIDRETAAPEMLEALQRINEAFLELEKSGVISTGTFNHLANCNGLVEQAIAKAEGR